MKGPGQDTIAGAAPAGGGIGDIARRLDVLLRSMADLPSPPAASGTIEFGALDAARRAWREEREREQLFGLTTLANPAWDILLDLFIGREEGREVTVGAFASRIKAPEFALVRCIANLIEAGLVIREDRPQSSAVLVLADEGLRLMCEFFTRVAASPGGADA